MGLPYERPWMKDKGSTVPMEHMYSHCHTKFKYKMRIMMLASTVFKISKKEGKDQESIQPSNQWESDKVTIRHHNDSKEVGPFPAVGHKASTKRRA